MLTHDLQPAFHGDAYWAGTHTHPAVYTYLPLRPFPTLAAFLAYIDEHGGCSPEHVLLAMLAKSKPQPR